MIPASVFLLMFLLQGVKKSFSHVKDVGMVQVKVLRAEGLMAADVTGKKHLENTTTSLPTDV